MSSVQESETGSGLINGKDAVPHCNYLHDMGHIQGPTPIQFDKIFVNGIITDTIVQYRSNAFIGFLINADKKNFMFIEKKENTPTIHQNITLQNITF